MKRIFIILVLLIISLIYSLDYTISPNTYSIQSGDFDNDGDEDIVVGHINPGTLSYLNNYGDGYFDLSGILNLTGIAECYLLVNLDDDPAEDAVIYSRDDITGFVTIVYNGEYEAPYSYNLNININTPIPAMGYGDLDGDNDFELVFSSWGAGLDNLWGVMYNLGDREFSEPEWFECPNQASNAGFYELECRDLDNNGFDDIIAYTNPETYIYYSDGNSFELDSLNCYAANGTMVSEDMDNDGDYDIVVSYLFNGTTFKFYENIGDHQFEYHEQNFEGYFSIAYPCDINNDQYPDIVNIFGGSCFKIHYNTGNFQFYTDTIYLTSYGEYWTKPTFSDLDGNGTEDIAFIRYGIDENNLTLLYNDGEGNFLGEPVSSNNSDPPTLNYFLSNYPNPFTPTTTFFFALYTNSNIELTIYNIKGQKVKTLINEFLECNYHSINWNGDDEFGKRVSAGIYFYSLSVNGKTEVIKKCLMLKQ